jgi:hypothetical protein
MANGRASIYCAVIHAMEDILHQTHAPFMHHFSLMAPADAGAFLAPVLQGNEADDSGLHRFLPI